MARKAILEGGKRDDILAAALELFLKNGYEGTSVRMILEQVGGEVGMFYHYFSSKEELFNKALELFMRKQSDYFSFLMIQKSNGITPKIRLEQLIECYESGMGEFEKLSEGAVHWSVFDALHDLTLDAMLPALRAMINDILQAAGNNNAADSEWLAPFILKGISGLFHEKSFARLPKKEQISRIIDLHCRVLQVPHGVFND